MDPEEILAQARQPGEPPEGWTIIPLDRKSVQIAMLGWIGGAIVGLGLFALLLAAVYSVISPIHIVLLAILAFVGFGSLYLAGKKAVQLRDAAHYLVVMTPELFIQQTGKHIITLPWNAIGHITLRGVFGGEAAVTVADERDYRTGVVGFSQMLGGRQNNRPRRSPDSLSFVDLRNDMVIKVAEDNSFTDLPVLEELLRNYVDAAHVRKS